MLKLQDFSWTSLVNFFTMPVDVFSDAEAGAHLIDSPYAFPRYNILQREFTAQYTKTNMTCHFLYINIYLRYSY
jgi:hypothetical protein